MMLPAIVIFCLAGNAQTGKDYVGDWQGTINVGVKLRIVFHIKEDGGTLKSTADSPDQAAFGMKCDTTIVSADSIRIKMGKVNAVFEGKLNNDSTIEGRFIQGQSIPLILHRSTGNIVTASEYKRPQTPRPPFPYKSEDLEYKNADNSLQYGATITIPEGKGPFPAALLITGSGPQDRNETLMGHQLFAVLADALTKNGFVVLRVDDRGIGKSTGKFSDATSADFANDVNTGFDYLLSRPEVDKKKAGLIGHSEGGMIAPMVASSRKDVDFIVLLAGPGVKIDQLMAEQNAAILRSAGVSDSAINSYVPLYKKLMNIISAAPDTASASVQATIAMQQWVDTTNTSILKELGFPTAEARQQLVKNLVNGFSGKWFKYFISYDPQPYLQKLNTKVLALNGDKDLQVIASSNLAGIESALKKSKSKTFTVRKMPGLNHLFQTCNHCTIQEYVELEETFSPSAIKEINEWLNKNVK